MDGNRVVSGRAGSAGKLSCSPPSLFQPLAITLNSAKMGVSKSPQAGMRRTALLAAWRSRPTGKLELRLNSDKKCAAELWIERGGKGGDRHAGHHHHRNPHSGCEAPSSVTVDGLDGFLQGPCMLDLPH